MRCRYENLCSGCPQILMPYEDQIAAKKRDVLSALGSSIVSPNIADSVVIESCGEFGFRERVDLTYDGATGALGLYDLNRKNVVDLEECPQLTPELNGILKKFRANRVPSFVGKGSVRLRVAPDGAAGVWLDFANADVKQLLHQRDWLSSLLSWSHVEIGQRSKPLTLDERRGLKLSKVLTPRVWSETMKLSGKKSLPLFGTIKSFTQVGRKSNFALLKALEKIIGPVEGEVLELFSGLGNFSIALASLGFQVTCYENDPQGELCWGVTASHLEPSLRSRIHFMSRDVNSPSSLPDLRHFAKMLVDPPRSGLGRVTAHIAATATESRPRQIVYVSCYLEALQRDTVALSELGYQVEAIHGVDQFPQTNHCEWIVVFHRQIEQNH